MARLTGKIALISGSARGMGAAHARAIVAQGGKVVIADILDEEGRTLAEELGDSAVYVHLDVTRADDWTAAVDLAVTTFGGLNVLVNNAGIVNFGELGEYTAQQWALILGINLTGPFLGITAAKDALIASAPSSIINVSSTAGFEGAAALHGYTASKFGLRGLTKSVALELGAHRVRANSIHPGVIKTPMTEGLVLDQLGALGRAGEPEEVSNLVVFLASDESSFSTGSEFIVDGGDLAGNAAVEQK
jgi:3alpha(or 20beta)-hydroxysteroid dehydrogenase